MRIQSKEKQSVQHSKQCCPCSSWIGHSSTWDVSALRGEWVAGQVGEDVSSTGEACPSFTTGLAACTWNNSKEDMLFLTKFSVNV